MLSRSKISWLRSLQQKKYRDAEHVFLVEGEKGILEGFQSMLTCRAVFATQSFLEMHASIIPNVEAFEACADDLQKAGSFETNAAAIAVFEQYAQPENPMLETGANIYLDRVKDPGNLGTIVRIADWYGLKQIFFSPGCVDFYNPKTIASSMGSFAHVVPVKTESGWIETNAKTNLIGADMQGSTIHTFTFPNQFVLVMGSESHGISEQLAKKLTNTVNIPRFGQAESLNVAMATGIILDNWKRQQTA